jgi:hypothetical protein
MNSARRILQLIDAGKTDAFTAEQWRGLNAANKGELGAFVNYLQGFFTIAAPPRKPRVSRQGFAGRRQAQDGPERLLLPLARLPESEYAQQAKEYQANCAGKDLTDDCKLRLDKLNLVVDRIIDALARSVSMTTDATRKPSACRSSKASTSSATTTRRPP